MAATALMRSLSRGAQSVWIPDGRQLQNPLVDALSRRSRKAKGNDAMDPSALAELLFISLAMLCLARALATGLIGDAENSPIVARWIAGLKEKKRCGETSSSGQRA
jgi:hypothetical protein